MSNKFDFNKVTFKICSSNCLEYLATKIFSRSLRIYPLKGNSAPRGNSPSSKRPRLTHQAGLASTSVPTYGPHLDLHLDLHTDPHLDKHLYLHTDPYLDLHTDPHLDLDQRHQQQVLTKVLHHNSG